MTDGPVLLDVRADHAGGQTTVHLTGVLDMSTVGLLRETIEPLLRDGADVVVDLSEVTFCDSTGLGAIVTLHRRAGMDEATFALRSPRQRVAAVLKMTGVDQVVPVHQDRPAT